MALRRERKEKTFIILQTFISPDQTTPLAIIADKNFASELYLTNGLDIWMHNYLLTPGIISKELVARIRSKWVQSFPFWVLDIQK